MEHLPQGVGDDDGPLPAWVGRHPSVRELARRVERLAKVTLPVLISGETGVGKTLVARHLHRLGAGGGPLVTVACPGLSPSLLESELFGHERGAFTGAVARKPGLFEQARGGTLVLDQVGDLRPELQSKLLRVLQEGTFRRVGGTETLRLEARVISTTNVPLGEWVGAGRFREDLFHRLKVVALDVPPLRSRREDVPLLVEAALTRIVAQGATAKRFSAEALRQLACYDWPGNVRELLDLVEMGVYLCPAEEIGIADLPGEVAAAPQPVASGELALLEFDPNLPWSEVKRAVQDRIEHAYLDALLRRHGGRILPCAARSGWSRRTLSSKLKAHKLDKAEYKARRRSTAAMP